MIIPPSLYQGEEMPYKNKEEANAASRRRYAENPEVRRKAREASNKWIENNKEKWNSYRADWATNDRNSKKEEYKHNEFVKCMRGYGTTLEWYRDKLIEQKGLCAICGHLSHHHGTMQRLQVDHNHACCDLKTKSCGQCNRGLLCADCNMKLSYLELFLKDLYGMYEARIGSWTWKALQYLRKYERKNCINRMAQAAVEQGIYDKFVEVE